ncbi:MAG: hypothetical protein NTY35_16930 [Planctomycetota bacterium]|nr:hypothetical protein [Planctomycetota bacterium]
MSAPGDPETMVFVVAAAAAGGVLALQLVLVLSVRRLEKRLGSLDRLQGLEAALQKLAEREAAIDLRRTEHTLLDVRDQLKRLEDRLLSVVESRAREAAERPGTDLEVRGTPASATSLVTDRILARLLALGYERIQIVTSPDDLALLSSTEGSAIVEARRDGALCKGRVRIVRGVVGSVEVQPAYSAFP